MRTVTPARCCGFGALAVLGAGAIWDLPWWLIAAAALVLLGLSPTDSPPTQGNIDVWLTLPPL